MYQKLYENFRSGCFSFKGDQHPDRPFYKCVRDYTKGQGNTNYNLKSHVMRWAR